MSLYVSIIKDKLILIYLMTSFAPDKMINQITNQIIIKSIKLLELKLDLSKIPFGKLDLARRNILSNGLDIKRLQIYLYKHLSTMDDWLQMCFKMNPRVSGD